MACFSGRMTKGLFRNGQAEYKNNSSFTQYNYYTGDSLSGGTSFVMNYNSYGSTIISNTFIAVDTSKWYQLGVSVKTIQRSYNNRLGSGHLGFACYDKDKLFVDLMNCGGLGNTYLSRDANPGDTIIYVQNGSAWYNSTTSAWRYVNFFPAAHPEWNIPHYYTRFTGYAYAASGVTLTANGDYAVQLTSPLPNLGYPLPAGTPVSNAQYGGTYNYALGAPDYPETWTTYITPPFTGESRNSTYPFRNATKFIKFNNLPNYNYRLETSGNSAYYAVDNIFLIQLPNATARDNFFYTTTDGFPGE